MFFYVWFVPCLLAYGADALRVHHQQAVTRNSRKTVKRTVSVLTYNLWGSPAREDWDSSLNPDRIKKSMEALKEEVLKRRPAVIAFQEYNETAFEKLLKPLWKEYRNCKMLAGMVRLGVRKDVTCQVVDHAETFSSQVRECPKGRGARSYQALQINMNGAKIVVVGLHLMSGGRARDSQEWKCRKASLHYSFKKVIATGRRGIVMGDMNWFRWLSEDQLNLPRQFEDAALVTDAHAVTYPSTERNPWKPKGEIQARLDRVFYTKSGLKATSVELVNKRLETSSRVPEQYNYISDHIGLHATFEIPSLDHQVQPRSGGKFPGRGRGGPVYLDGNGKGSISIHPGMRVQVHDCEKIEGVCREGDVGTVIKMLGDRGDFQVLWDLDYRKSDVGFANWSDWLEIFDDLVEDEDESEFETDDSTTTSLASTSTSSTTISDEPKWVEEVEFESELPSTTPTKTASVSIASTSRPSATIIDEESTSSGEEIESETKASSTTSTSTASAIAVTTSSKVTTEWHEWERAGGETEVEIYYSTTASNGGTTSSSATIVDEEKSTSTSAVSTGESTATSVDEDVSGDNTISEANFWSTTSISTTSDKMINEMENGEDMEFQKEYSTTASVGSSGTSQTTTAKEESREEENEPEPNFSSTASTGTASESVVSTSKASVTIIEEGGGVETTKSESKLSSTTPTSTTSASAVRTSRAGATTIDEEENGQVGEFEIPYSTTTSFVSTSTASVAIIHEEGNWEETESESELSSTSSINTASTSVLSTTRSIATIVDEEGIRDIPITTSGSTAGANAVSTSTASARVIGEEESNGEAQLEEGFSSTTLISIASTSVAGASTSSATSSVTVTSTPTTTSVSTHSPAANGVAISILGNGDLRSEVRKLMARQCKWSAYIGEDACDLKDIYGTYHALTGDAEEMEGASLLKEQAKHLWDVIKVVMDVLIEDYPDVPALILDYNHMLDSGVEIIAKSLPQTKIEVIYLRGNNIGDSGARALAAVLPETRINRLGLSDNNIGDSGVQVLADAMPRSNLRSMSLSRNKIRDSGGKLIADALSIYKTGRCVSIDIAFNQLSEEMKQTLKQARRGCVVETDNYAEAGA